MTLYVKYFLSYDRPKSAFVFMFTFFLVATAERRATPGELYRQIIRLILAVFSQCMAHYEAIYVFFHVLDGYFAFWSFRLSKSVAFAVASGRPALSQS